MCGPKAPFFRKWERSGPRIRGTRPNLNDQRTTFRSRWDWLQVHPKIGPRGTPPGRTGPVLRVQESKTWTLGIGLWNILKLYLLSQVLDLWIRTCPPTVFKSSYNKIATKLGVKPQTAGGPVVHWDHWLDGGGARHPAPSNQLCRYHAWRNHQVRQLTTWWRSDASAAIQSILPLTAHGRAQRCALPEALTDRLVSLLTRYSLSHVWVGAIRGTRGAKANVAPKNYNRVYTNLVWIIKNMGYTKWNFHRTVFLKIKLENTNQNIFYYISFHF